MSINAMPDRPGESWFALQVMPRHEVRVANALEYKGCVSFLPVRRVKRKWTDRVKVIEVPLFPTYLFCQMNSANTATVYSTPGVRRVVGLGAKPSSIPDHEIESLQILVRSRAETVPVSYMSSGQKVQVLDGPLAGLKGIVVRPANHHRLIVSVNLIMRSVMVDISASSVVAVSG